MIVVMIHTPDQKKELEMIDQVRDPEIGRGGERRREGIPGEKETLMVYTVL